MKVKSIKIQEATKDSSHNLAETIHTKMFMKKIRINNKDLHLRLVLILLLVAFHKHKLALKDMSHHQLGQLERAKRKCTMSVKSQKYM